MKADALVPSPIFLDVSELVLHPLRTGIQRVEREIIRLWPGPSPLIPCRIDPASGDFVRLSPAVFDILQSSASQPADVERALLRPHLEAGEPVSRPELSAGLFNAEVYYDPARAKAYRALCRQPNAKVSWLLYDFLPFLQPQDYPPGAIKNCMHYLWALREIPRVSFISEHTQIDYSTRIMRDPKRTGPHFSLGGDSFGARRPRFRPGNARFAYIGTIEPRKNVAIILRAFERLWAQGVDAKLTIVGRMDNRSTLEPAMLKRLQGDARLRYLEHADDATVRDVLQRARATLFVSRIEGFGIPPYESLAAGIPVIASPGLPSLERLPPGGRITLSEITPDSVATAVMDLLDDDKAARLWEEAARLDIPTWQDFVGRIAAWLHEPGHGAAASQCPKSQPQ
ncbi:MAG: glycosyltransferase [Bradyrhizobium sp.]